MHVACGYQILSHVGAQLLLSDKRCDVNLLDDLRRTALMTAVSWVLSVDDEHAQTVRLLLADPRTDINKQNDNGETVLYLVCDLYSKQRMHLSDLTMLLQEDELRINIINHWNESALSMFVKRKATRPEFSSHRNVLDVVKQLLSHRADPNVPAHLLAWAVNFCPLDVCRELLHHGADPNSAFTNTEVSIDQHGGRDCASLRHTAQFYQQIAVAT